MTTVLLFFASTVLCILGYIFAIVTGQVFEKGKIGEGQVGIVISITTIISGLILAWCA